jgi:hypothetical protein
VSYHLSKKYVGLVVSAFIAVHVFSITAFAQQTSSSINLSSTAFSFGEDFVGNPFPKTVTMVGNTGSETITLRPSITGDDSFSIVGGGCAGVLAPGQTCSIVVQFLPMTSSPAARSAVLQLGIPTLAPGAPQQVQLTGQSVSLAPGTVAGTASPLVAQYTMTLPQGAVWRVNFGQSVAYGLMTSSRTLNADGSSSMYVAGMQPNTTYHMQATIQLSSGATAVDQDHTFTTGLLPAGIPAKFPAATTPGMTPQPGIELVNTVSGNISSNALATDLSGNVIWMYTFPGSHGGTLYPVKQMPNGNFLCMIAPIFPGLPGPGTLDVLREFDLAGNTIAELSMDTLNQSLAANGFPLTLANFSHDMLVLPNGHILLIANTLQNFTDLPGYPGTTQVAGDTVVDLDSNLQPKWVWNSFDHLDINRYAQPDWTHANALAYSRDDGNFLISLRNQNWVLKIDYRNGAGTGNVIWHLGPQGDFALQGGTDPTDWFYEQHYVNFTSTNTTGLFSIALWDNGDGRQFPPGVLCGPLPGQTPCNYSTAPEFQIDENAMTATFLFHAILSPVLFTPFAGDNLKLPNGDFEFDAASATPGTVVAELKPGATVSDTPQTVWHMTLPGTNTYRALRQPSLYPGVQW